MKILMVSIFSSHFFNWTEQLRDSGHEVHWLDVFDSNTRVQKIDFVQHVISWRYRINYPGRYYVKKHFPELYRALNLVNERKLAEIFEKKVRELQPDVVHSFGMHLSCFPIHEIMMTLPEIKWVYSSWGSDLYHYKDDEKQAIRINQVLSRINYIFTDCNRDYRIAKDLGFNGEMLGVFPGRGGFDFKKADRFFEPTETRKTIIIKGYEGKHGRCTQVLKALEPLKDELRNFNLVVFGANREVKEFVLQSSLIHWDNLEVLEMISNDEVLQYMGKSLIYIGNSMSDGIPNTLLEAIIMGSFPIQSNPGGATAEIIYNRKNGFLIQNPQDGCAIGELIRDALSNFDLLESAVEYNNKYIKPNLERDLIEERVLKAYTRIEYRLSND